MMLSIISVNVEDIANSVVPRALEKPLVSRQSQIRLQIVTPHDSNKARPRGRIAYCLLKITVAGARVVRRRPENRSMALGGPLTDDSAADRTVLSRDGRGREITTVEVDAASDAPGSRIPGFSGVGQNEVS